MAFVCVLGLLLPVCLYISCRVRKRTRCVCVCTPKKNVAPLLLLLTKLIKEQVGSSLLLCFFFKLLFEILRSFTIRRVRVRAPTAPFLFAFLKFKLLFFKRYDDMNIHSNSPTTLYNRQLHGKEEETMRHSAAKTATISFPVCE